MRRFVRLGPFRSRRWLAAALATLVTLALGLYLRQSSPPRQIVMATGQEGGMYDTFGREYARRLGHAGLRVDVVRSNGSVDNLRRLLDGRADIAFVQSGTSRLVDDRDGRLRGLAAVYLEPLWIFYRSPAPLTGIPQLAGRAISVGPPDSGTEAVALALLNSHGMLPSAARVQNMSSVQARQRLEQGQLDAAFFVASYRDPVVQALLRRRDVRLMGVSHEDTYTRNFPSLNSVRVSAGLFDMKDNIPPEDVTLLSPAALLLSRDDLHPRVIEMLLRVARAVHGPGDLMNAPHRFPSREGVDVPMHETAESYLVSGESFLSRALPYWAFRWVFLLPLLAVWIPAVRFMQEVYSWRGRRNVVRLYGRLRDAEAGIWRAERREDLEAAIASCEALGREVGLRAPRLPAGSQRDIYQWRQHLILVLVEARRRLSSMRMDDGKRDRERLAAAPSESDGDGGP